jgi:4a-hydroxytetrahydrobiopterin dehydratase
MAGVLDEKQIQEALTDRPKWEYRDGVIVREVKAADFPSGIRLVDAVAEVAESVNHHPDIDIRYNQLTFQLVTHAVGGVTKNDIDMAGRIDELVDKGGA